MKKKEIEDIKQHFRKKSGKFYIPKDKNKDVFVKIDNFWWNLDIKTPLKSATVYNMATGRMTEIDISTEEFAEADNWQGLDWQGTSVLNNELETGWLDREGNFYGCDYRCHNLQAYLIHRATERELELAGFIKITNMLFHNMNLEAMLGHDKNYKRISPTEKQMKYLMQSNITNLDEIKHLIRCASGEVQNLKIFDGEKDEM